MSKGSFKSQKALSGLKSKRCFSFCILYIFRLPPAISVANPAKHTCQNMQPPTVFPLTGRRATMPTDFASSSPLSFFRPRGVCCKRKDVLALCCKRREGHSNQEYFHAWRRRERTFFVFEQICPCPSLLFTKKTRICSVSWRKTEKQKGLNLPR